MADSTTESTFTTSTIPVSEVCMAALEEKHEPENISLENGEVRNRKEKTEGAPMIGLSQEELEKVRDGPYWKPIRYSCFALFWLIWAVMFAGGILIIVLAPKKKD